MVPRSLMLAEGLLAAVWLTSGTMVAAETTGASLLQIVQGNVRKLGDEPKKVPDCTLPFGQCGGTHRGKAWNGPTDCTPGYKCQSIDESYSLCKPDPEDANPTHAGDYAQCGGEGWGGLTNCSKGFECEFKTKGYSQCTPADLAAPAAFGCTLPWSQCGGYKNHKPWNGPTCCTPGFACEVKDEWYSQCKPIPEDSNYGCALKWKQCGGEGWDGPTCCHAGFTCVAQNQTYSQCRRKFWGCEEIFKRSKVEG